MTAVPRRRRSRRGSHAQAVIETAIVIPVLLALVAVFLGVMVQVAAQQEMDAATKLAAESFFQAPRLAVDAPGTFCCSDGPSALDTSAMPKGCRFAAETFYGTMSFRQYLVFASDHGATHALCTRDGTPLGRATRSEISCEIDAHDTSLNPPGGLGVVRCSASAALDLSRTPLAWAVLWRPVISATAEAVPPPFRQ